MDYSILRLPESAARWDLAVAYLKLRSEVFVLEKNWALNVADGMEFEQYDLIGATTYVVAHDQGKVVGGARLIRCDHSTGGSREIASYMIRDAYLGRINLPRSICWEDPPTETNHWELTRLVSVDRNPSTVRGILDTANAFIKIQGGERCLFLGSPAFMRMARNFGYDAQALGPVVANQDGRFLAFSCAVV